MPTFETDDGDIEIDGLPDLDSLRPTELRQLRYLARQRGRAFATALFPDKRPGYRRAAHLIGVSVVRLLEAEALEAAGKNKDARRVQEGIERLLARLPDWARWRQGVFSSTASSR